MDEFWAKVDVRGPAECWPWLGSRNPNGYGRTRVNRRGAQVHRVAFELTRGPIPKGLVLDHLCRTRSCCNPAHLDPVPQRENINANKVVCLRGHPLSGDNLGQADYRLCLTCKREQSRAYRLRRIDRLGETA